MDQLTCVYAFILQWLTFCVFTPVAARVRVGALVRHSVTKGTNLPMQIPTLVACVSILSWDARFTIGIRTNRGQQLYHVAPWLQQQSRIAVLGVIEAAGQINNDNLRSHMLLRRRCLGSVRTLVRGRYPPFLIMLSARPG